MTHKLVYNTSTLRIYVADYKFCENSAAMDAMGITDAIATSEYQVLNRPKDKIPFFRSEYVSWGQFYIGDDELMYDARDQVKQRLEDISNVISKIRDANIAGHGEPHHEPRIVCLYDSTGRDSSVLAAGYYIIYRSGTHSGGPTAKVTELQRIYFSPKDREDEVQIMRRFSSGTRTDEDLTKFAALKAILALKNLSFRVMLDPQQKKNLFYD